MSQPPGSSDNGARRRRWDTRYREALNKPTASPDRPTLRPPSELLHRWVRRLAPGRALDLACGSGRNALLLARSGWSVLGVDYAPAALHIARREADRQALKIELAAVDLDTWPIPAARFDLVCVFRFLDRSLCPSIAAAVRPGGVLIYETFTVAQRQYGSPRDEAYLLDPGELPTLFGEFRQLESFEGVREEGGQRSAVAGFVGRKVS